MLARVRDSGANEWNIVAFVAAGDEHIVTACEAARIPYVRAFTECRCGTDRVAEAFDIWEKEGNETNAQDIIVNVQADEPLMPKSALLSFLAAGVDMVSCGVTEIRPSAAASPSVVKVAIDIHNRARYMSRSLIPGRKDGRPQDTYHAQICIYAFPRDLLRYFAACSAGLLEATEDIELLRVIEHGDAVQMVPLSCRQLAVDTELDVERVNRAWEAEYGV